MIHVPKEKVHCIKIKRVIMEKWGKILVSHVSSHVLEEKKNWQGPQITI